MACVRRHIWHIDYVAAQMAYLLLCGGYLSCTAKLSCLLRLNSFSPTHFQVDADNNSTDPRLIQQSSYGVGTNSIFDGNTDFLGDDGYIASLR